jgi:dihydrofolate reductase
VSKLEEGERDDAPEREDDLDDDERHRLDFAVIPSSPWWVGGSEVMSATVLYMSMSVDGFIAGPNEGPGNGLGDGGHRLHEWVMTGGDLDLEGIRRSGTVNGQIVDEFMSTGAVVAGRGTFEPAGGWDGDHHDGVPIFVLARGEPGIDISQWPLVNYVNDVTKAMTQAKEAAGERNVLVHGAGTAQLALAAGVLDELELHVVPVLFGQGRRLFENLAAEQIELERTRVLAGENGVVHMRYRVRPA